METTVLKLAAELCGADEGELLLGALCDAAETSWERRLKSPGDGGMLRGGAALRRRLYRSGGLSAAGAPVRNPLPWGM